MTYIPHTSDQCDHIRSDRYFNSLVTPPKAEQAIEKDDFFDSSLASTAETKIGELLERHDWVSARFTNNYRYLKNRAINEKWDDFSLYFWQYFEGLEFEETLLIKKWLKYWTRIYENCSNTKLIEPPKTVFSDEDIVRAREYPIEDLFNGDLRHQYGKSIGLCPFHDESTPSFTIFEDNHFHCFGCGAHGDSIEFYMKLHNASFIEAVKELQ